MQDREKSREELVQELERLRQRVATLQASSAKKDESTGGFEAWFWHSLIDNTPLFVMILDEECRIRFVNRTDSGAATHQLVGKSLPDLCHPDYRPVVRDCVQRVFQTGKPELLEGRGLRIDTEEHWYACRFSPIGEPERVTAVAGIATNVTDRVRVEQALQQAQAELEERVQVRTAELAKSEARYRTLVETLPDGVVMTDLRGHITFVSGRVLEFRGDRHVDELIGRNALEFIAPGDQKRFLDNLRRTVEQGMTRDIQYSIVKRDGTVAPAEISAAMIHDESGQPGALVAIVRDVMERKLAQEALERERRILKHMLQAGDHERQTIAYDIHDGLAQHLAGAIMQFEMLGHLKNSRSPEAADACHAGLTMLRQAHFEARRLISGVRPPILDESGVVAAIAHLVHEPTIGQGPKVSLRSRVTFNRLPPVLENAVYRIVQEGLANACKHSQSPKVQVSLLQHDDCLRIEVRDWGLGFDPKTAPSDRYGLEGIRQRVRLLGGRCQIRSKPGEGTVLSVDLPVVERDAEE